jgi:GMP synthase PP-ATPase subunit
MFHIFYNIIQEEFIGKEILRIREICGPKGRVIGAVSGGVDSTVAAKLMHEAIGDRYVVVFKRTKIILSDVLSLSGFMPSWSTMASCG